jgi:hypothetical protein
MATERAVHFSAGDDEQSELQKWRTDTGNQRSSSPSGLLADLRADTPQTARWSHATIKKSQPQWVRRQLATIFRLPSAAIDRAAEYLRP